MRYCVVAVVVSVAVAQVPTRNAQRPAGLQSRLPAARELRLPELAAGEGVIRREADGRIRAGVHRRVPAEVLSKGSWTTTPEGRRVWRVTLRSPGAAGVRVRFSEFNVGAGCVWLYSGEQVAGPYTGRGIFGDGEFWTATVYSEAATLEYEPAADLTGDITPPFTIRTLSHHGTWQSPADSSGTMLRPLDIYTPVPEAASGDSAAYCHLDPNCYPEWQDTMKSVAQLAYEKDGQRYLCSGALVNTRDNSRKPYLLTAGHCINSESSARSLEVYWTYQTSSCNGKPNNKKDSLQSSLGATYVASSTFSEGDYSLLLLRDVPAGVPFATWDTSDPAKGSELVGIHHPAGSYKRISFGVRTDDKAATISGQTAPPERFLQVSWRNGRTEPGSSGSPLFSGPGVVVGMLSYGPASSSISVCEINPNVDGYGRFSNAYEKLKDWFENLPAAAVVPAAAEAAFTLRDGTLAPAGQSVRLITQSTGEVNFKARADAPWIRLSAASGTVSATRPAALDFTIDTSLVSQPDTYAGTITIQSGSAAPQYINVRVDSRRPASNVVVTITPDPVREQSTAPAWFWQIQLAEKGGVATRLTKMKMNGVEQSVSEWFDDGYLDAGASRNVYLQSMGPFPSGSQYFEFWGTDVAGGQSWYRVATVNFVPLGK